MNFADQPLSVLRQHLRESIPLARAMQLDVGNWDGNTLTMNAPLAPNINDKGCAFGGSIVSAMTLAGWGLVTLTLQHHDLACDVYVARSDAAYLVPVWHDFEVSAVPDSVVGRDTFLATLAKRGKARIDIRCHAREAGQKTDCATLHARFVARRSRDSEDSHASNAAQ